jgi:hypothetical protein
VKRTRGGNRHEEGVGDNVNMRVVSSVLYLTLDNNAISFLLDDRRLESSHDSLGDCQ